MKTSSYDDPYEEEDENMANADEYHSYEAPVTYGYEASFAKCKVAPIAESNETDVEDYEASFAKYNVGSGASSYEAQSTASFEASFAKCSVTSVAESHEAPAVESYEEPDIVSYEAPVVESDVSVANSNEEAPSAAPQHDNYTPSMPPPVPKRTLLPYKTSKETTVIPETPQHEMSAVTEEADAQNVAYRDIELVSPEEVTQRTETGAERWSDSTSVSLPGQVEDVETVSSDPGNAQCEPVSELYYTASSEVSLLSDTELADKVQNEEDEQTKDDRKNVIAGHVAAMRERFESMTRTNTPCPDLIRSLSPSLEVFRNLSPSPDRLA